MLVRITPASCCYARSAAIQSRCNAASPVFEHIEAVSRRNLALRVVRTAGDQATSKSLYDLLGIEGTADRSEIKKAFRSLVSKLHPDLSTEPDEQGRFEAIVLAYEVLEDDNLKQRYDELGLAALGNKYNHLKEFLSTVPPPPAAAGLPSPGKDLSTVLGIELQDAANGCEQAIRVKALKKCTTCKGSGLSRDARPSLCPTCHGTLQILCTRWAPGSPGGKQLHLSPCPACEGSGVQNHDCYCHSCDGKGVYHVNRRVWLRVPAGVSEGQVLKVVGQGDAGQYGGAPGNLYVKLQVYNLSNEMERRGNDLYSELTVGLYDILLGCSVTVTTLRGPRPLKVPPGTDHGSQLCVPEAGVVKATAGGQKLQYGNHYFKVRVNVPKASDATDEEREVMQRLAYLLKQRSL